MGNRALTLPETFRSGRNQRRSRGYMGVAPFHTSFIFLAVMKTLVRSFALLLACGLLSLSFSRAAVAQEGSLEVGDTAPAFEAPSADGDIWSSKDALGEEILVVYFYPAAMTGGCTKQACAFRDHRSQLMDLGAEVVAVSGDEVEGLQVFKRAHNLNFPLLSDADGEIARKFGVPVNEGGKITKEVDGKEVELERGVTTARWTFVLDRDGKVVYKNTEVNPERDSEEVMAAIQSLQ